eukprot:362405-Chlamydomonas_euryale.AAC.1
MSLTVAHCCSLLLAVAHRCPVLITVAHCCSTWLTLARCRSMLLAVAHCCSLLCHEHSLTAGGAEEGWRSSPDWHGHMMQPCEQHLTYHQGLRGDNHRRSCHWTCAHPAPGV